MRQRLAYLPWLALSFLVAGCAFGPRGKQVFAPVVAKPADAAWPFALPAVEEPKEPKKDGPRLRVYTWFIAGQPSDFAKLGIDCDKPFTALAGGGQTKVLSNLLRTRRAQVITAPRLTVIPGQTASIAMTTRYDYLGDYQRQKPEGQAKAAFVPVMHHVLDGLLLSIRAELDGDQIVFTTLAPRMANSLGMRDCKSFMNVGSDMLLLVWQEPIFLAAEGLLAPTDPVACKAGTTVAIPLKHTVQATEATVRKHLDCPVEVLNADSMKFLTRLDKRGYPLPGRIVVLVSARLATEKDDAPAEAPKP
ncbi:MAG TPA: hypothetical protein VNE39_18390 [Planctomycetota bacterium]|nr:hypothetical protein [Planctomycetota bacterium]